MRNIYARSQGGSGNKIQKTSVIHQTVAVFADRFFVPMVGFFLERLSDDVKDIVREVVIDKTSSLSQALSEERLMEILSRFADQEGISGDHLVSSLQSNFDVLSQFLSPDGLNFSRLVSSVEGKFTELDQKNGMRAQYLLDKIGSFGELQESVLKLQSSLDNYSEGDTSEIIGRLNELNQTMSGTDWVSLGSELSTMIDHKLVALFQSYSNKSGEVADELVNVRESLSHLTSMVEVSETSIQESCLQKYRDSKEYRPDYLFILRSVFDGRSFLRVPLFQDVGLSGDMDTFPAFNVSLCQGDTVLASQSLSLDQGLPTHLSLSGLSKGFPEFEALLRDQSKVSELSVRFGFEGSEDLYTFSQSIPSLSEVVFALYDLETKPSSGGYQVSWSGGLLFLL